MGVTGLWPVLSDICERKPLTYLSGKRVAVDLSGWVVQAIQCKGLNTARNPHLRNLFFRVSKLLQLDVYPIFITEGEAPAVKEAYFKERQQIGNGDSSISRTYFVKTLEQCEELLKSLGVPCVKSSGEAEGFCAFLCLNGVVDGVITEDNDAFLYGADVVYRDLSIEPTDSHVNVYCLKSDKNKHNLDRKKLVALALLLGCDYTKGVPGIGKETAVKLLSELKCEDILQRFKDWKNLSESELFPGLVSEPMKKSPHCGRCGHVGSSVKHKKEGCSGCNSEITCYLADASKPCQCPWHINNELIVKKKVELKIYNAVKNCPDFPNLEVVNEYLNFTDIIPSSNDLDWTCPKLLDFQNKVFSLLGWTFVNSFDKFLPLVTSWQQYKLRADDCDKTSFIYEPVEILKERSVKGDTYFDVQWKVIDNKQNYTTSPESLITSEYGERFSVSYKALVEDFYNKLKKQKQSKAKGKKLKIDDNSRKIDEFFPKKAHSKNGKNCKAESSESVHTKEPRSAPDADRNEPSAKRICV